MEKLLREREQALKEGLKQRQKESAEDHAEWLVYNAKCKERTAQRERVWMEQSLAAYTSGLGTEIESIEPFTAELAGIVEEMQIRIQTETKILDGTEIPERETIEIPRITEEEFRVALDGRGGDASRDARVENEQPPTEEPESKE